MSEDVISGKIWEREEAAVAEEEAEEEKEPAVVKKRKRPAMDSLVGEIISTAGVKVENDVDMTNQGDVNLDDLPLEITEIPPPIPKEEEPRQVVERKPSMLHSSRSTSFAARFPVAGPSRPSPLNPDPSFPSTAPAAVVQRAGDMPTDKPAPAPSPAFYTGLVFSHAINEQCEGLEKALKSHGGLLVSESDRLAGKDVDYVIIRL
jgi:DNA replication regulator DPB11